MWHVEIIGRNPSNQTMWKKKSRKKISELQQPRVDSQIPIKISLLAVRADRFVLVG